MRRKAQPSVVAKCPTCGKEFRIFASNAARGVKHCSRACQPRTGEHNSKWRGGRSLERGRMRVYVPTKPGAKTSYVYEYRLVAEQKIGRPLRRGEVVHHVNGDHTDNRPENLEVLAQSDHARLHFPQMMDARREKHGY